MADRPETGPYDGAAGLELAIRHCLDFESVRNDPALVTALRSAAQWLSPHTLSLHTLPTTQNAIDPVAWWQRLRETRPDVFDALAATAPRVAAPWTPYSLGNEGEEREHRLVPGHQNFAWFARNADGSFRAGCLTNGATTNHPTKEEARAWCDRGLRTLGYALNPDTHSGGGARP